MSGRPTREPRLRVETCETGERLGGVENCLRGGNDLARSVDSCIMVGPYLLDREQVRELIAHLSAWLTTGSLVIPLEKS